MLRCRWEGGTPPVSLRWWDGAGQALGDPAPSTTVVVLSTGSRLGGQDYICVATHPLQATGTECRLRLGKPEPSLGGPVHAWVLHPCWCHPILSPSRGP